MTRDLSSVPTRDLVQELEKSLGVRSFDIPQFVEYFIEIYDGDGIRVSDSGPARILVVID